VCRRSRRFSRRPPGPCVVVGGEDGRLYWLMDAFTTSDSYPRTRAATRSAHERINYIPQQREDPIDAYTGRRTFYVFRRARSGLSTALSAAVSRACSPTRAAIAGCRAASMYGTRNPAERPGRRLCPTTDLSRCVYNRGICGVWPRIVALPDQRQQVMNKLRS